MKPPTPATRKLLFQGISHDGRGRTRYLKERHQVIPEKKYKYPMVSSWEYGWHVGKTITLAIPGCWEAGLTFLLSRSLYILLPNTEDHTSSPPCKQTGRLPT